MNGHIIYLSHNQNMQFKNIGEFANFQEACTLYRGVNNIPDKNFLSIMIPLWNSTFYEGVEKKVFIPPPLVLLVVSLRKTLNGITPS